MDATLEARATVPRRRLLKPGWPLYVVFVGFPFWWVLGLGGFVWPIVAVPMLLSLLRRKRVFTPPGSLLWFGFIIWMIATAVQIDSFGRMVGFAYRGALYLSATILFLYIFNSSGTVLEKRKVITILAIFWTYVVIGGYLGILFPNFSFTSPAEVLMPHALVTNDFVHDLVHPSFADVQDILGYPVSRPSAPFIYTNDWGGNFALLIPFVILAWGSPVGRRFKKILACFAVVSLVPVVVSLNRGLWLSLSLGLLYAAVRLAIRGRPRAIVAIVACPIVLIGAIFLTPLHKIFDDRLATPHSNNRRVSLYEEAVRGAVASPLFGYGAPRPSKWNPDAPSVGTQGQIWLVLFSHGFPGAFFFAGWFIYTFWRLRSADDPLGFWMHVMILILLVQFPVYGMLPMQLHIVMIGIALAWRERRPVELPRSGALPVDRMSRQEVSV
jgi:hypothetical protein